MKSLKYWGPAIGFAVIIFGLSSIPGSYFNGIHVPEEAKFIPFSMQENPDKVVHFSLYSVFGWLWLRVFLLQKRFPPLRAALFAFIVSAVYGATDEWHQLYTPDRYCDLNDWLADCSGAALSILLASLLYLRFLRNSKKQPLSSHP